MSRFARVWRARPSISRRIAITMALSLGAVQLQAFVQIWLFARPVVQLTGTRFLADTMRDAVRDVILLPPSARNARLHALQQGLPVRFVWSSAQPWADTALDNAPVTARLVATLRQVLGHDATQIDVSLPPRSLSPNSPTRAEILPVSVADQLGAAPIEASEPDILIPVNIRIAVRLVDGSWVSAASADLDDTLFNETLPITLLVGGGAIIVLMSNLIARRIVAPLERLIVAAKAIGTSRTLVTVGVEGLGEFAAVACAFEDMQQRLIRFVGDRTQMLAAISHDLRSSLTRLKIATEGALPDNAYADDRGAILAEIIDMEAMLELTLSFATGEAMAVPSRPIDVAALLISLVDNAVDAGKRCDYHGPNHSETIGHPISLKRAFSNLIDNAVKYGAAAHVSLASDASTLRIAIADEGPGIPPELVEEAFKPFRRLDPARSEVVRGSGLGMTIARDAVQSHGGIIWMENDADQRFTVFIELPLR
jgi:signal transduction histidine kinase